MDYIELIKAAAKVDTVSLTFGVVFGAMAFVALILTLAKKLPPEPGVIFLTVGMLVLSLVLLFIPSPDRGAQYKLDSQRTSKIQSQISDSYGMSVSLGELRALHYPNSKPQTDFEVFGSFKKAVQLKGTSFTNATVYLVWADGKFGLSKSADGEKFTPLEAQK